MTCIEVCPYAGGIRGGSDEPPFLAGYTYYLCDRFTLDHCLVRRTMAIVIRDCPSIIIYAHRKVSVVPRRA